MENLVGGERAIVGIIVLFALLLYCLHSLEKSVQKIAMTQVANEDTIALEHNNLLSINKPTFVA